MDYGELMVDKGDGEGIVDRGVDDAEAVTLAGLELDAGVSAASVGVDVQAIEENVVCWVVVELAMAVDDAVGLNTCRLCDLPEAGAAPGGGIRACWISSAAP